MCIDTSRPDRVNFDPNVNNVNNVDHGTDGTRLDDGRRQSTRGHGRPKRRDRS
jgi:hypothetical protein